MVTPVELKVRRARESDAAAMLALRARLASETTFMLLEPGEFQESAQDEAQRISRLNGRDNCLLLVAEQGSELIGSLAAFGGDVRRTRHRASLALGVVEAHWGTGTGGALLRHALRWSREVKLRRVELTVHTSNHRAIALYERCGFAVEGVRRSSLLVDGRYVDEYLMAVINDDTDASVVPDQ